MAGSRGNGDEPDLTTYVVEFIDGVPVFSYPLVSTYVKVLEGDRELLRRAPEIANDDDPEAARQNAAAIGRRAGRVAVPDEVLDDQHGGFHDFFTGRGRTRSEQALAAGRTEQAELAGTTGRVAAASADLELRDEPLLVGEERRLNDEAKELRDRATALEREHVELHPLERGLISPPLEILVAAVLGLADVALFGVSLEGRAEVSARIAWVTAILVGLAIASAGWALGRGVVAPTRSLEGRRRALGALILALALAVGWFLRGMEETRMSGGEEGELATLAFGAPLCAIALVGTSIVSFITGAGLTGREIAARARDLAARAAGREGEARAVNGLRHELRETLAEATGAQQSAHDSIGERWKAAEHRAQAELAEGEARWGLARLFARLFPPPAGEEARLDVEALAPPAREPRVRRALVVALAALGAALVALAGELAGLPGMALAALGAGGGALGALLALWRGGPAERKRPAEGAGFPAGGGFEPSGAGGGARDGRPRGGSGGNGGGPAAGEEMAS